MEPSNTGAPTTSPEVGPSASPTDTGSAPSPTTGGSACSGNDANRTFFGQAATAMSWAVYCAVVPAGWYLETGSFRLANGGHMDVTYRGPNDARIALSEGNICDGTGTDVNACAPRDAVIGTALMADQTGELGQLANGLVLDVDRGANPSWRVTGLGVSEADFVSICAAMFRVPAGG